MMGLLAGTPARWPSTLGRCAVMMPAHLPVVTACQVLLTLLSCPALTAPPKHVQKLGLKRAQPEAAGMQYAQQSVVKLQSDATFSAAPTEVKHVSPPFEHFASAGAIQSNNSMGTASGNIEYKIKGMIGQGTQGKVWDAVMTRTGKAVVMKGLHTEHMTDVNSKDSAKREQAKLFWRAFKNEIDILEACGGHPNVVKIVGRAPDYSHFMMEKADLDLNKCLKMNSARLTLGVCSQWFKELLTGVAALHVLGVTHTDLKPENLLIGSDNHIKICDFGMAQRATPGTMWAVTGELSTLWYRAPELLLGSKTFDEKIDEWAVGCIGMEMLCGATIFQGQANGTCRCPDVTHRNFNSDQLGKILQVVGSPKSMAGYQCAGHIKDWPTYARQLDPVVKKYVEAKRLPNEQPDASGNVTKPFHSKTLWAQAISALLVVSPQERTTCAQILNMPLFHVGATPFAVSSSSNSNIMRASSSGAGLTMMPSSVPARMIPSSSAFNGFSQAQSGFAQIGLQNF